MKPVFCPVCHRPVEKPEMLNNSNIKTTNGVKVLCPHCNKGKVKFKPEPKEEVLNGG